MTEPSFLSLKDILFIHDQEIELSGGEPNIRDEEGIKACVDARKPVSTGSTCTICLERLQAVSPVLPPVIRLLMGINARV